MITVCFVEVFSYLGFKYRDLLKVIIRKSSRKYNKTQNVKYTWFIHVEARNKPIRGPVSTL